MTEFNRAWLAFKAAEPGCFDDGILHRRSKDAEFLENRLSLAFSAGWNAAQPQRRGVPPDHEFGPDGKCLYCPAAQRDQP